MNTPDVPAASQPRRASPRDATSRAGPGATPGLKLILASASPRRLELLAQIGVVPTAVRPAEIDETQKPRENPRAYVQRMAAEKARAVPVGADEVVLAADTTVVAGRRILGKPGSPDEAALFLRLLSGRRHRVLTAIALRAGQQLRERLVESQLRFRRLSEQEIGDYVAAGEWQDKAGGYAIQGRAAAFVPWLSGSFSAVVGLPLAETATLLQAAGWRR